MPQSPLSDDAARRLLSLGLDGADVTLRARAKPTAAFLGLVLGTAVGLGLMQSLSAEEVSPPAVEATSHYTAHVVARPAVPIARCMQKQPGEAIGCAEAVLRDPDVWTHDQRGSYVEALYAVRALSAQSLWEQGGAGSDLACTTALDWVDVAVRAGETPRDAQIACHRACAAELGLRQAVSECRPIRRKGLRTL